MALDAGMSWHAASVATRIPYSTVRKHARLTARRATGPALSRQYIRMAEVKTRPSVFAGSSSEWLMVDPPACKAEKIARGNQPPGRKSELPRVQRKGAGAPRLYPLRGSH
jgi:hypothetical protein